MAKIDMTGKRFGRLTCIKPDHRDERQRQIMWLCKCDCGNEVVTRGSSLRYGSSKSCGCLRSENFNSATHTLSVDEKGDKPRLYRIWLNMKSRCLNPNTPKFKNHGGRGITICDSWRVDYVAFHNWAMSHGYKDNLTLERKDNDGDYSPSNCIWATYYQQNSNTRQNHLLTFRGETMTIAEWARKLGINHKTLGNRLTQYGWEPERAICEPVRRRRKKIESIQN